jgi:hypothetical protein
MSMYQSGLHYFFSTHCGEKEGADSYPVDSQAFSRERQVVNDGRKRGLSQTERWTLPYKWGFQALGVIFCGLSATYEWRFLTVTK